MQQETLLHVVIQENMISKFIDILQEENLYTIHNLRIVSANDLYKILNKIYVLHFIYLTTVSVFFSLYIYMYVYMYVCMYVYR